MNAQFRAKLVSYWYKNDAEFRAKKVISHKTTQLLRKRIDCFVETLVEPWRILYRKLYGGGLEALLGRTLPQKVKWGSEAVQGMLPSLPRVTLYI